MGIFNEGILGGFSGKVGPIVGSRWRTKTIVRAAPTPTERPPSTAQQLQRDKFKFTIQFLNPIKGLLNQTFGADYGDKTPFNRATSYMMKHALQQTAHGFECHYPKLLISKGELQGIEAPVISDTSATSITLQWTDTSNQGYAHPTDGLLVVLYAPTVGRFEVLFNVGMRSDAQAVLTVPTDFENTEVILWASFAYAPEALFATSKYVGRVSL